MSNTNELIFVNNILTTKLTIRKAAKQLGLRRDDLVNRVKEMLKNDEENLKKLDLIIITNKIIYGHLEINQAAKKLGMSVKELDNSIRIILKQNKNKLERYENIKKEHMSNRKKKGI